MKSDIDQFGHNQRFQKWTKKRMDTFSNENAKKYRAERRHASQEIIKNDRQVLQKRSDYETTMRKLEIDLERARQKCKRLEHSELVNLTGLD